MVFGPSLLKLQLLTDLSELALHVTALFGHGFEAVMFFLLISFLDDVALVTANDPEFAGDLVLREYFLLHFRFAAKVVTLDSQEVALVPVPL